MQKEVNKMWENKIALLATMCWLRFIEAIQNQSIFITHKFAMQIAQVCYKNAYRWCDLYEFMNIPTYLSCYSYIILECFPHVSHNIGKMQIRF